MGSAPGKRFDDGHPEFGDACGEICTGDAGDQSVFGAEGEATANAKNKFSRFAESANRPLQVLTSECE
jgi:hypothetical protein